MVTPSKQMSVTDLSTTTICVSNTSVPICIRQNTATRREPNKRKGCTVCVSTASIHKITRGKAKQKARMLKQNKDKRTPSVVKVV